MWPNIQKWSCFYEQLSPIFNWTAGGLLAVQSCPRPRSALATNLPTRWANRGAPRTDLPPPAVPVIARESWGARVSPVRRLRLNLHRQHASDAGVRSTWVACVRWSNTAAPRCSPASRPGSQPGLGQRLAPVLIEALVAELAVEALDVAVLRRHSRLDQDGLDAVPLG